MSIVLPYRYHEGLDKSTPSKGTDSRKEKDSMGKKIYITRTSRSLNKISDYIRGELKRQHLTQEQFANRIGVKQQTLSKWLRNPKTLKLENFIDIIQELHTEKGEAAELICTDN